MVGAIDSSTLQDYAIVDPTTRVQRGKPGFNAKPATFQTYGTIFIVPELPPSHEASQIMKTLKLTSHLRSYLELDKGWDGFDGVAASIESFNDAVSFISKLPKQAPAPKTMLSGDGEIALYWEDRNRYAEAAFPGDGTFHFIMDSHEKTLVLDDISPTCESLPVEIIQSIGNAYV